VGLSLGGGPVGGVCRGKYAKAPEGKPGGGGNTQREGGGGAGSPALGVVRRGGGGLGGCGGKREKRGMKGGGAGGCGGVVPTSQMGGERKRVIHSLFPNTKNLKILPRTAGHREKPEGVLDRSGGFLGSKKRGSGTTGEGKEHSMT